MSDNQYIGQHIKSLRRLHSMTQKELAQNIGKTESTIQKYEAGKVDIPWSVLEKIASVLGTTAYNLVAYTSEEIDSMAEEQTENRLMALLYMLGYNITKLEGEEYEMVGRYGSIIATKTELEKLYTTFLDYMSYITDKFYNEKREEKFK